MIKTIHRFSSGYVVVVSAFFIIMVSIGPGFTFGASIGPIVTGYIFDSTGSYKIAFLVCAALGIIGIILAVLLRPTKRLATPRASIIS